MSTFVPLERLAQAAGVSLQAAEQIRLGACVDTRRAGHFVLVDAEAFRRAAADFRRQTGGLN